MSRWPEGLTPRQEETLAFVRAFYRSEGMAPSVRQVSEFLGVTSSSTAYGFLKQLAKKGYLIRRGHRGFIPKERVA